MHPDTAPSSITLAPENVKHKPIAIPGKEPEKQICAICSKLVKKYNMKVHLRTHEKPTMECPKCDKKFRWNTSLTAHINSAHSSTFSYSCEFCNKQFKDQTNLKNHRYSHTGGGNYTCGNCDSHFLRKDQYSSHLARCIR